MKKIMFVCLSLKSGGVARVISVLADRLEKKGYEVIILPLISTEAVYKVNDNVKIPELRYKTKGLFSKINRIREIRRCINKYNIDTLVAFSHYNAMYSVIAAFGKKVRLIGSERNDPAQIKNRLVLNSLRNVLYRKLDVLVCQTEEAKKYFSSNIQSKSVVILNPLTNNLPMPYTGERENRIVSFSRLDKQKNIPMLIDAFSMLHKDFPHLTLDIYGDGSEKESLLQYIKSLDMNKYIHIFPFTRDVHQKIYKASMFALASNYEGLSNSMLEAMALGLPSVVTDCPCGGAAMIIKDGENGLLVPVGDAYTMYEKMKKLMSDKDMQNKISQNAASIRKLLDADVIAEKWINIL